jgi:hypothetical protein
LSHVSDFYKNYKFILFLFMFVLLFSVVTAQILNLPNVTVNIATCENEIEEQGKEFDLKCLGTSQVANEMMDQFCKAECIQAYDVYVNKIKSSCSLTPAELTVLTQDIADFNSSQGNICEKAVNVVASATNTAPTSVPTAVAPRTRTRATVAPRTRTRATVAPTAVASAPTAFTSARPVSPVVVQSGKPEGSYPTAVAAPSITSSAESLSVGIFGSLAFLLF